jgi:DNA-binding SARP family transcriptional activator
VRDGAAVCDRIGATVEVEVEVAVLGPVGVHGAARPFRRARTLELVAYLAVHPGGVTNDAWATALWPERAMAPPTLHSTCSAARRSLGRSRSGDDHLPRSRGGLRLGPTVGTDWTRFGVLAAGADPSAWQRALQLVRGRPFEGLERADWTILDGLVAEMEVGVVDVALRLAEHHLGSRATAAAARRLAARRAAAAARAALRASPYDERLYRVLLRAADAEGHPAGVESVMGELGRRLGAGSGPAAPHRGRLVDLVHPETAALYRSLSRRRAPAARGSGRAAGMVVGRL